jgi:hypothetical protein
MATRIAISTSRNSKGMTFVIGRRAIFVLFPKGNFSSITNIAGIATNKEASSISEQASLTYAYLLSTP